MEPKEILAYFKSKRADIVELVRSLVLIESPTSDFDSQLEIQTLIKAELEAIDYEVLITSSEKSGGWLEACTLASDDDAAQQLLIGHSDTVWPIGTLAKMPWKDEDNKLSGPGIFDMKAGLVEIVFALKAIYDLKLQPPLHPAVLINSDEETGSRDSTTMVADTAQTMQRVFVLEPALTEEGKLKTTRRGGMHFTIEVTGKAAHAGLNPQEGRSAIFELARIVTFLHGLNDLKSGISVNVGRMSGGIQANVIAPSATADVDVRVLSLADAKLIEDKIRAIKPQLNGTSVEIEKILDRPPMEKTAANTALWKMAQRLGASFGLELKEGLSGGSSDGSTTSLYTATLDGLGAVGDGAHAPHEFVYVDKLLERMTLLTLLLLEPPVNR